MLEPQLPEIISAAAATEEEKIKSKPQIKTAVKKELHTKEIADRESPSPSSSSSSDTTITSTTNRIAFHRGSNCRDLFY
jgi:hypothetical protein